VKETFYDASVGWNLRNDGSVINAKINTPIAVISWASGTQIRVYYLDNANFICERAYEGGATWVDGSLRTYNFQAAPFSQLAASIAGDNNANLRLRVYFQQADGRLQELQLNGTWGRSTRTLPIATLGSALSAFGGLASLPDQWWLYYQDPSLKMQETLCPTSTAPWVQGGYRVPGVFRPGASISAVGWGSASEPRVAHLLVYVINEKNEVVESAFEQGWNNGNLIAKGTATDSAVSAIQWDGGGRQIRVYFQRGLTLLESAFDGGHWNGLQGNAIPIYH